MGLDIRLTKSESNFSSSIHEKDKKERMRAHDKEQLQADLHPNVDARA
jgi:hypothetical protein